MSERSHLHQIPCRDYPFFNYRDTFPQLFFFSAVMQRDQALKVISFLCVERYPHGLGGSDAAPHYFIERIYGFLKTSVEYYLLQCRTIRVLKVWTLTCSRKRRFLSCML